MSRQKGLLPAQLVAISFSAVILLGTAVLAMPFTSKDGKFTGLVDAFFTSTSAVAVTGLVTLDTASHWNIFGQIIIAILIEIGGFGIVSFATLIALLLDGGRISIRGRMNATLESSAPMPDVRTLLRNILGFMFIFQSLLALILGLRFYFHYGYSANDAIGHGIFHAVSAFNNAGFALYTDNMMGFAGDAVVVIPVFATVFIAGFGFPVLMEIRRRWSDKIRVLFKRAALHAMPKQWSLNSRIILVGTAVLSLAGAIYIGAIEWNNSGTLGAMSTFDKVTNSLFASIIARTAGFNTVDIASMHPTTWLGMDLLMFIGGGSASTAGGIKIGTAVVLAYIVITEMRGDNAVNIGNRRLPRSMQRQALTIVALTVAVILCATMVLRLFTNFSLDAILLEVISAIGTVGLSAGVTPQLPEFAKILIALVMLFGRLGPLIVATSLAGKTYKRHFEYPKERPLIG